MSLHSPTVFPALYLQWAQTQSSAICIAKYNKREVSSFWGIHFHKKQFDGIFCIKHIIQGLFSFLISSFFWVYMWLNLPSTHKTPRLSLNCKKTYSSGKASVWFINLIWGYPGQLLVIGKGGTDWECFWLVAYLHFYFPDRETVWMGMAGTSMQNQIAETQGF